MRLVFALICLLSVSSAHAYPNFIRHEYKSCTSCHWSARGGGLLNDYGQGIAGAMSFFPVDYEGPPDTPLYRALTFDKAVTHGLNFRLMTVKKENRQPSTFPMQIDYLNGIKFGKVFRTETIVGVDVRRDASGKAKWNGTLFDVLAVRKAMLTWAPVEGREYSVGRDFLPIGLTVDDHTALFRTKNRRGVLDYPTQLKVDRWTDDSHLTPFAFAPSFEESFPNREYGVGTRAEFYLNQKTALGGTFLLGRSPTVARELFDVFARWSPAPPVAVLFEYDYTIRQLPSESGQPSFGQHVFYLKPSYEVLEWLDAGPVVEFETRASPFFEKTLRYGFDSYFRIVRRATFVLIGRDTFVEGGSRERFVALQLFAHL